MRVLFVTDHIHIPQGTGGGERNTHDLCLALLKQGDDVAVLCSLRPDHSLFSWTSRLRRKIPSHREFSCDRVCGYPVYRGWHPALMTEVVKEFRPEIVVVQSTHPDPFIEEVRRLGLPQVIYLHEVEDILHLRRLKGLGITVIANSKFVADRLHEVCGLNCEVVYPIIDPAHYEVKRHSRSVLFVNTIPRKGLETALAIATARPDVPFNFILGWTNKPDVVKELSRRTRGLANVRLRRPSRDMRPNYSRTRLLLVPSHWEEAWGRVVTEAHVTGIPVLASRQGGLPESVGPGGVTVAANANLEEWLSAFYLLWDNNAAHAAYAEAAKNYSARAEIQPGAIVSRFRSIIASTIKNYS